MRFRASIMAVVISALGLTALAPARQALQQRHTIMNEERRLAALRSANSKLTDRLTRLNDPEYIEKLAREQLGLVRPGEISYVVVAPAPSTSTVTAPPPKSRPFYVRLWNWVNGLGR